MRWTSALAIYLILWFFCLFLVLPFHARRGNEAERADLVPGQEAGAPDHFDIMRAIVQVTLLTAVIFALFYANYQHGWVSAEDINLFRPPTDYQR